MLARTDAGATRLTEPVDLDDLVLEEIRATAGGPAIIDGHAVSAAQVVGDRDELRRVVRNLLDNARRYATTTVSVELREHDGQAVLVVADDGPGIPAERRDDVFERFARLDEARSGRTRPRRARVGDRPRHRRAPRRHGHRRRRPGRRRPVRRRPAVVTAVSCSGHVPSFVTARRTIGGDGSGAPSHRDRQPRRGRDAPRQRRARAALRARRRHAHDRPAHRGRAHGDVRARGRRGGVHRRGSTGRRRQPVPRPRRAGAGAAARPAPTRRGSAGASSPSARSSPSCATASASCSSARAPT